jgi:hypothetical protein
VKKKPDHEDDGGEEGQPPRPDAHEALGCGQPLSPPVAPPIVVLLALLLVGLAGDASEERVQHEYR